MEAVYPPVRGGKGICPFSQIYEKLGKTVDRDIISVLYDIRVSPKDFANYLWSFTKYKTIIKMSGFCPEKLDGEMILRGVHPYDGEFRFSD